MTFIIFFIILIYFSLSTENIGCDDISTISETYKTLEECSSYEVEENMNCCVGVISIMGKNSCFCQSFDKTATEQDISTEMDKKVQRYENQFLGAVVKAKASCKRNVTPFQGINCNIDDSQNSSEFNNCSSFKKSNKENFCCLFSGNVLFDNDKYGAQFCYEVNKTEACKINEIAKDIDSKNRMIDIKYLNCSPEIPIEPSKKTSNYIKNSNFFFFFIIIILYFV